MAQGPRWVLIQLTIFLNEGALTSQNQRPGNETDQKKFLLVHIGK